MALFPSGADWAQARQSARLARPATRTCTRGEIETSNPLSTRIPNWSATDTRAADWVSR